MTQSLTLSINSTIQPRILDTHGGICATETTPDAGAATALANQLIEARGDKVSPGGGTLTQGDISKTQSGNGQTASGFSGGGLLLKAKVEALARTPAEMAVDSLNAIDSDGRSAATSAFIETGYNYLAAVRDGRHPLITQGKKLNFETQLSKNPVIDALSNASFEQAAKLVLENISQGFNIAMDPAYQPSRPDPAGLSLTRDQVQSLLEAASATDDYVQVAKIQCRLSDAVKGMTSPRPIDGPVAKRSAELNRVYVNGSRDGNLMELTDRIYDLIKG
jgi:hypothetical protein